MMDYKNDDSMSKYEERRDSLQAWQNPPQREEKESRGKTFALIFFPIVILLLVLALVLVFFFDFKFSDISSGIKNLTQPKMMTIDGKKVENAEFAYFYMGSLSGLGLEPDSEKLDMVCLEEDCDGQTWREYAYEKTAEQILENHILYTMALEEGLELSEEEEAEIKAMFDNLVEQLGGEKEANEYLVEAFGKPVNLKSLEKVFRKLFLTESFYAKWIEGHTVSSEEALAFYRENSDDFEKVTFRLEFFYEGFYESSEDGEEGSGKEEAKKAAEDFLLSVKSEDDFVKAGQEKSELEEQMEYEALDDSEKEDADAKKQEIQDKEDAFLATMDEAEKEEYEKVQEYENASGSKLSMGKMDVASAHLELAEWLFADSRKAGDKEVFDAGEGYYVVFFVSRDFEFNLPSVRHILISPNEEKNVQAGEEFTSEEWEEARKEAKEILSQVTSKESFVELVKEKSTDPGSKDKGGLYEDLEKGQMVVPFEMWAFDASRQEGDTGLVRTNYGYHIMWFEEHRESDAFSANEDSIKRMFAAEKFEEMLKEQSDSGKYKYKINSDSIKKILEESKVEASSN